MLPCIIAWYTILWYSASCDELRSYIVIYHVSDVVTCRTMLSYCGVLDHRALDAICCIVYGMLHVIYHRRYSMYYKLHVRPNRS